jgi:hypothetical protein
MSLGPKAIAQCCGYLDSTYQHQRIPPVSWQQRFSRSGRGSVARQSWLSHRQPNQLRTRPGQSSGKYSFGKRVRDVTVRGQSFIDNGLSTSFVTHVPQRRDDWDKGFKDKVYHIDTQILYQHGPRARGLRVTIHEGRSDYPMIPQEPLLRLILIRARSANPCRIGTGTSCLKTRRSQLVGSWLNI